MSTIHELFDGSDMNLIPADYEVRQIFEQWILDSVPCACLDRGTGDDYIVLGLEERYAAFAAGYALGHNVEMRRGPTTEGETK